MNAPHNGSAEMARELDLADSHLLHPPHQAIPKAKTRVTTFYHLCQISISGATHNASSSVQKTCCHRRTVFDIPMSLDTLSRTLIDVDNILPSPDTGHPDTLVSPDVTSRVAANEPRDPVIRSCRRLSGLRRRPASCCCLTT